VDNKKITIGILAHVDAGKTTLSEAILYASGEIRKPGRVDHGDSFLDDNIIERNRGITIFSRQARFMAGGTEVTMIDTPGHTDFAAEMERSLSVIDEALLVVSGSEGVQAHTKTLYRMLRSRGIPVFVFINKMDIAVRSREDILSEMISGLGMDAVDFSGAASRSDDFIDGVTLYSPSLAESVLERGEISDEEIAGAISRGEIVPCMFGSALRGEGIEDLLEVIGRYSAEPEYGDEFGAKVYKAADAEDGERLCFVKITGGELRVRDKVVIRSAADGGAREAKVNQIRLYSGSRCTMTDSATAGTVCAVTGLGRALPGDALGSEEPQGGMEIKPFMVYSVYGPEGMDPHRIMDDLSLLTDEDPALSAGWSRDGSDIEIRLMGRVQLEVLQAVIKERFGYDVSFGAGSVLYLETITDTYEGVGHFEPLRHYAEVHLIMEPGTRGSGIVINSTVPEDELAINWQRLIMTHLEEKEHRGVLTGAPLTDVRISLAAGRAHDKHTVGGDFREATYRAVRQGLMQARRDSKAVLLEPWCNYEIELPAGSVGRAMTDIKQMGGSQDGLEQRGDTAVIKGRVPASEIADYMQTLAGYTSGYGRLSCIPCGYDICHNAEEVIGAAAYDPERDTDDPADSVFVNHSGSDIVKWDEAMDHMHIASVLKRRSAHGSALVYEAQSRTAIREGGGAADVREEARRRAAAEKELRAIFEKTYGPEKKSRYKDKVEKRYREGLSEEEEKALAERNLEIRARHARTSAGSEEKPVLILVDGYNLIFADEYLKELSHVDMGSARDQLTERLSNFAGYRGCEVSVVFDAYRVPFSGPREEEVNGVSVIFTSEDEPADILMGKMTSAIKDRQIYVVSSDALVQQDALGHGSLRIASGEFLDMLSATEDEIRKKIQRNV